MMRIDEESDLSAVNGCSHLAPTMMRNAQTLSSALALCDVL